MKVTTLLESAAPPMLTIVAVIDFDPWPFKDREISFEPSLMGTVSSEAVVTWASHRTFNLMSQKLWDRLIVFEDGRCAVAHRDHRFIVPGTKLEVR